MRWGEYSELSRKRSTTEQLRGAVCVLASFACLSTPGTATAQEEREARSLQEIQRSRTLQQSDAARHAAELAVTDERPVSMAFDPARFGFSEGAIEQGRVVAVQSNHSQVVSAAADFSRFNPNTVFIEHVRPRTIATAAPAALGMPADPETKTDYKLGFEVTAFDAQTNSPLKLDAWARDSTGLGLVGSAGVYTGQFHVALTLGSDPNDRSVLASPVNVAVAARGATIEPRPVAISELGRWHDVSISVPEVESDFFEISVSADPADPGNSVPLSVIHPEARLWSTPASVIGWGIGESTIFIEARGIRAPKGLPVALRVDNGSLSTNRVTLDAAGQAELTLRSSRHPQATIEIMSAPLQAGAPLVVPFTAPWWFLGAATVGGLAGAFLRGRGRKHWFKALAIGVITALVMTLAYAVGIDWPERVLDAAGIPKAAEASVFVLGAIGALIGVTALVPKAAQT